MKRFSIKLLLLISFCFLQGCSVFLNREFNSQEKSLFDKFPAPTQQIHIAGDVKITFFGTSTLLFDDGHTKVMIDGFFSRPKLNQLIRFEPDEKLIRAVIKEHNLDNLAVVVPVHSHHDHAMDAPLFAKFTGATLLGTTSTFRLGVRLGLDKQKWTPSEPNTPYDYGKFTINLLPAKHGPLPTILANCLQKPKAIQTAIRYPAFLCNYKEGDSYSVQVLYKNRSIAVVNASTAYLENALQFAQSDVIFLGIAGLNKLPPKEQRKYYQQTVAMVNAKYLVPIHWDDFMRSKLGELYPTKKWMGNFEKEMAALTETESNER